MHTQRLRFVRKFLRVNWRILVLTILVTTSLWLLNALNKRYTTSLSLPFRLEYNAEGLISVQEIPDKLSINVTGMGWDLIRTSNWIQNSSSLVFYLKSPTTTKFISKSTLQTVFESQLSPLILNYTYIDTLHLDIQPRATKSVQLYIDSLAVPLVESYRIYTPITLEVDTFVLTGPKSFVDRYPNRHLVSFDSTEDIDDTFTQSTLFIHLPYADYLQAYPGEVKVDFKVAKHEQKTIRIPVNRLNFPRWRTTRVVLVDSVIELNYVVQVADTSQVHPEYFTIIADYLTRNRKTRTILPQIISAPKEALEVQLFPETLRLRYERK